MQRSYSMIRKSGHRFCEKIMLNQNAGAPIDLKRLRSRTLAPGSIVIIYDL